MKELKIIGGVLAALLALFILFYTLNYFDVLTVDSMDNWLQDVIAWFENVFEGPGEVITEVVPEVTQ